MATSVFAAPVEVLAGPPSIANQASVGPSAPIDYVQYRRYHRRYYRGYGYDPTGAIVAGAALGAVAAGVAAASQPRYYYGPYYGYPGYGGWGW